MLLRYKAANLNGFMFSDIVWYNFWKGGYNASFFMLSVVEWHKVENHSMQITYDNMPSLSETMLEYM